MSVPGVFAGNPSNQSSTRTDRVWEQPEFFGKPRDRRKYNSIWMRSYNKKAFGTQDLSLFIAKWVEYRYLQLYEVIGFLSHFRYLQLYEVIDFLSLSYHTLDIYSYMK